MMSMTVARSRVAGLCLLVVSAAPAAGQGIGALASADSTTPSWHLRLGLRSDPRTVGRGALGMLGLEWQRPASRFALRVDAEGSGLGEVSAAGRFDLGRGKARPYVFTGAGLRRLDGRYQLAENAFAVELHGGVGIAVQIGQVQFFTETRFQSLALQPGVTRSMSEAWVLPIAFGFRY